VTLTDKPEMQPEPVDKATARRRTAPQIIGGSVLLLIGLLWLLERTGVLDVSVTAVLGLGTLVVGISLMVLAREGPHVGLIVFGTILALITTLTAAAPFEGFQGGVGDRTIELTSVDDIQPDYNLAMGKMVIDLSRIDDLEPETALTASVGMGELIVIVPADTAVRVEARAGAGQVVIFDKTTDGVGVDETYQSSDLDPDSPSLNMDLDVFTGRVEVTDD
jgi:hypothetical protein